MKNWYLTKANQLDQKITALKVRRDELQGEPKQIVVNQIQHLISERNTYQEEGEKTC